MCGEEELMGAVGVAIKLGLAPVIAQLEAVAEKCAAATATPTCSVITRTTCGPIVARMKKMEERMEKMVQEMKKIREENEELKKKVVNLEKKENVKKVILKGSGLKKDVNASGEETGEEVRQVLGMMGIDGVRVRAERMGKYREGYHRPIMVECERGEDREKILGGSPRLKGRKIWVEQVSEGVRSNYTVCGYGKQSRRGWGAD